MKSGVCTLNNATLARGHARRRLATTATVEPLIPFGLRARAPVCLLECLDLMFVLLRRPLFFSYPADVYRHGYTTFTRFLEYVGLDWIS